MPGCAAVGCNNRSEKGYIMKCFPRDPTLRKIWQERVARADWEPSNNSFLCHVHFEPQEWSITQSGRIRLKKNAIPSIFTITSTRKSPKKRKKLVNIKKDEDLPNDITTDFLENDTEHSSSIGHLEEKDSDYQDIDEVSIQSPDYQELKQSIKAAANSKLCGTGGSDLQGKSVVVISDDNQTEVDNLIKGNLIIRMDKSSKDIQNLVTSQYSTRELNSSGIKVEIKPEIMDQNTFDDSYDEIEEKLKQICDGSPIDNGNYNNKTSSLSRKRKKNPDVSSNLNSVEHSVDSPISINYKYPSKNEVGHILTDKRENVEIIFGTESGDEKCNLNFDEPINIKEEGKIFSEDIEENFTKDEVHVIPNMRAAMKRKRRTREEIMKSIKKSIGSASDQDANVSSTGDVSDNITEREVEAGKRLAVFSHDENGEIDKEKKDTTKFTIRVTGDPDDVTDIIQDLSSKSIGRHSLQRISSPYRCEENDTLVTSTITIEDYSMEFPCEDMDISDLEISSKENAISKKRKIMSSYLRNSLLSSDTEENKTLDIQNFPAIEKFTISLADYEYLQERIRLQENVIEKLTNQLIIYKDMENNLQNRNVALEEKAKEMETLTHRLNTRSASQSLATSKKNLESKQRLIEDLSNRVNYLEEMNKKLMKTVTLESQQKRKLEGQIKQRDNRIKELNWKLEKASKYLERAEKNTNTYRRKMLNMQTVMRRKKLLDEKMSRFSEMLLDSTKDEYSEKALSSAMEIRKTCGRAGYDKLLNYGFPLPPLPALRSRFLSDDFSDYHDSDEPIRNIRGRGTRSGKVHVKSEMEVDTKDSGIPESDTKEMEYDGAETVTGTVQDIFDENNDGDDFSTNELREHFILQLNAVM